MIPKSTVVAKPHDTRRCNAFGDVERLSEMDSPLVSKGAPSETFEEDHEM
jgi:hypothetical protein